MAEKIEVTLSDGRVAAFNQKQKLIKESTIADDGLISVRLDFVNGATRTVFLRPDMIAQFAAHGAEQKLGDCIAGETDIDDAVLAMDDLIARLDAGEWSIKREGGGFSGASVLLKALVEVSGKSEEDVKTFLSSKTQAEKLALRRSDRLRPVVERLEAEKASKSKSTVDTDALLGDLGIGAAPGGKGKKSD